MGAEDTSSIFNYIPRRSRPRRRRQTKHSTWLIESANLTSRGVEV